MAWARLDDRFHEHWKVAEAGLEATGLWTMCLTWASQARRTSPTPGVVPESVVARFAGPKAKRLAKRLHEVGLFDDRTDAGWPIHDFASYLPKYDAAQNAENGRRGGQARATKRTASKPPSEPPTESVAEPEQTSSMRASVRRNPVPEPSAPNGAAPPDEHDGQPNAGAIVASWIDRQPQRPPSRVVGQIARHVRELLAENFTSEAIDAGLVKMDTKRLGPSLLPQLVNEVANAPGRVVMLRGEDGVPSLTDEQLDDILGPDTESLPMPPPDVEDDHGRYQAWLREAKARRRAERVHQAMALAGQR